MQGTFTQNSTAIDPTAVKLLYDTPSSTAPTLVTSTGLTHSTGTGVYTYDLLITEAGPFEYRFTSTGTGAASEETYFVVRPQRVTT